MKFSFASNSNNNNMVAMALLLFGSSTVTTASGLDLFHPRSRNGAPTGFHQNSSLENDSPQEAHNAHSLAHAIVDLRKDRKTNDNDNDKLVNDHSDSLDLLLSEKESLRNKNDFLRSSPSMRYKLLQKSNGNLVLKKTEDDAVLWESGVSNGEGVYDTTLYSTTDGKCRLETQRHHHLEESIVVWSTTAGSIPSDNTHQTDAHHCVLAMDSEERLKIFRVTPGSETVQIDEVEVLASTAMESTTASSKDPQDPHALAPRNYVPSFSQPVESKSADLNHLVNDAFHSHQVVARKSKLRRLQKGAKKGAQNNNNTAQNNSNNTAQKNNKGGAKKGKTPKGGNKPKRDHEKEHTWNPVPSMAPAPKPTFSLTNSPTETPTSSTFEPYSPTLVPVTSPPTSVPSHSPTFSLTVAPSNEPTLTPTAAVTLAPTSAPTNAPVTNSPTSAPTQSPSPPPLSVREVVSSVVLDSSVFLDGQSFDDESSYQYHALQWLEDNNANSDNSVDRIVQQYALSCIYFSLTGSDWTNNIKWVSSADECEWFGVECEDGHVRALELPENNMAGVLPAETILLADSLTYLDIFDNSGVSNVGDEGNAFLGQLTSLEYLYYGSTSFAYDGIPTEIGLLTNLIEYDCEYTKYYGSFHAEIFETLPNITSLYLGGLYYEEPIPTSIYTLPNLEYLYVEDSGVTGDLSYLDSMSKIVEHWVDFNDLTGTIPTSIGSLTNLESLSLSECMLTGTLPTEFGLLPNLVQLWLYYNELTGTVPSELGNLELLEILDLEDNMLTGTVPDEICQKDPFILTSFTTDCLDESVVKCDCCTECF